MIKAGGFENHKHKKIILDACLSLRAIAKTIGCKEEKAKRVIEELIGLRLMKKEEGQGYQLVR